jgi:hypothetical protein
MYSRDAGHVQCAAQIIFCGTNYFLRQEIIAAEEKFVARQKSFFQLNFFLAHRKFFARCLEPNEQ